MMLLTTYLIGIFALALASATPKSYSGYQVLRTSALTEDQVDHLRLLEDLSFGDGDDRRHFDFWTGPDIGQSAQIMAHPEDLQNLKNFLQNNRVEFEVNIEDVESLIRQSQVSASTPKWKASGSHSDNSSYELTFDAYHSHDVMNAYLDAMAAEYSSFVTTKSIGSSYEGRDMKVLQINKAGPGAPIIFIEGGMHAREWIAPAVALYQIKELLENYEAHPQYIDNFNWHIIPMMNPDGYEYSRDGERLWRKTRSEHENPRGCKGVDLNRNWDVHWGELGGSGRVCADTYAGPEVFSEVESRHIRDYFLSLESVPVLAISFHSAAELWLYPYGWKRHHYPENIDEVRELGAAAVKALNAVHGQEFKLMNAADLYPASGISMDWYMDQGTRFTYTPELRDNGYLFFLPPKFIVPSGEEIWAAMEVMLDHVMV